MSDYLSDERLAGMPPVRRAAYSDRTAWIMAEFARLTYQPMPGEPPISRLGAAANPATHPAPAPPTAPPEIGAPRTAGDDDNIIASALCERGYELLKSFYATDTRAFIARLPPTDDFEGMLVLAFRGTATRSDVITDMRANLVDAPAGGRVHGGFLHAFRNVEQSITEVLREHPRLPLYITGHSLGGALAIVAARYLAPDSQGACYTFGAPRVADDAFFDGIKTPIYRIVNAADGVPRVPFGIAMSILLSAIRLIPLTFTFALSEMLRKHLLGYTHPGHLVFMNDADVTPDQHNIPYANLRVLHNPAFHYRAFIVVKRLLATSFRAAADDHAMDTYARKLLAHAQRRNRPR